MYELDAQVEGDVAPEEVEDVPTRGHKIGVDELILPLEKVMRRDVLSVSREITVADAVQQMITRNVGSVLITDGRRLRGIFSERDVVTRIAAKGLDPAKETVGQHMTTDPECLRPGDPIVYALNIMKVGEYRYVPLIDASGDVEGIVGMRDIVRYFIDFFREEVLTLPPRPVRKGPASQYGG